MAEERPVLAVDLGGTKVAAALVSEKYGISVRVNVPTLAAEGPPAVIKRLLETIQALLRQQELAPADLAAICVGTAGAVDMAHGLITLSPNLPGWHDIALGEIVSRQFGVKTHIINDAKAAALGEHRRGAGQGVDNLIVLTVGTGIGGGIIIGGRLYTGVSGSAGEIGHMTIDINGPKCACGNVGCWETLASGTALAREAQQRITQGAPSLLTEMARGGNITGELVEAAARRGDPLAQQAVARIAESFGVGLVNLVNIFNPGIIVVGGGMARMGELLFAPARRLVAARAFRQASGAVRIVPAALGQDAALLGAAVFAREQE